MGKECGAWVSRRLWGGGNSSPLKTTAWEATLSPAQSNWVIKFLCKLRRGFFDGAMGTVTSELVIDFDTGDGVY